MHRARRCLALLDGVAVGADPVTRLSPFALARLAQRAAREGRDNVSLWRAVSARAVEVAPQMQPMDMSVVLFAFARMRYRDRPMIARLAESTPAILGQFKAADITYYLAALARLDVQHKLVFNLLAREIARKLHDFSAAQLGELVYAYARFGLHHELLFGVLKKRIVEVVKALKPWHLAMVTNGFARLHVSDERFFTILAAEICRKIPDFPGRPLALVANAYARLGVKNRFLLELLGDEAFRRRGELEPQSVALLLNAHARLRLTNLVLLDYFAEDVPRRIRKHSMQSLCLVASAFARQKHAAPGLFEAIGNYACKQATSLYPRAVATLLYSFSEAEARHGVLFYNAPQHVMNHCGAYTTDELAMIARAYGSFQMVHLQLFDTITQALPSRMLVGSGEPQPAKGAGDLQDDPPPPSPSEAVPRLSSLVWLMEAYARLTIYDAGVLELLCDAIVRRRQEVLPDLMVQTVRAAATLSYAHPGLVELGLSFMAEHGEDLTMEELDLFGRALEDLGAVGDDRGLRLLERPGQAVPGGTPAAPGAAAE